MGTNVSKGHAVFILRVKVASEKILAQIQQINCLWKGESMWDLCWTAWN